MKQFLSILSLLILMININGCQKETELLSPFEQMEKTDSERSNKKDELLKKLKDPNNTEYYNQDYR